jgi:transposase-like protein
MTTVKMGGKPGGREEYWRERIAEHQRSGKSVARFCSEHGVTEQSFYSWRKRLGQPQAVRFALVETGSHPRPVADPVLELVLTTGERLRIGAGVDAAELRRVLAALRA